MTFIFDTELVENKQIYHSLTQIYGLGKKQSSFICRKLGFSKNLKVKDLSKDQITELLKLIDVLNLTLASDLKKLKFLSIKNLISIKSYRGFRRNQGLPLRGQRTHTNSKTARKKIL